VVLGKRIAPWLQVVLHIGALIPLLLLVIDFARDELTFDPIREITLRTGRYALTLLELSLACTPLHILSGVRWFNRARRPLGLYAFLYASLHFLTFIGLDFGFNLSLIVREMREKPFIQVGLGAFLILLVLAVTSIKSWMRRLGKNWKRVQRGAYLAGTLAVLVAQTGSFNYSFLAGRPPGASLEGYLMADTYRIPADADAATLIARLLETFDQRVTAQMRRDAQAQGLSLHEMVTLASIVEREALLDEERPIVASVYLNRLAGQLPEADGYLRADPTFQYARGYDPVSGRWWAPFQVEDVQGIDSQYNTFLYPGLPPEPICSPSLASLKAVVYPAETDYLYFYARGDGSHAFAKTYEEHLQNQALYGQP
jgi:DMSO/TMAO reductase YedYZ heme-binding membrane subunit